MVTPETIQEKVQSGTLNIPTDEEFLESAAVSYNNLVPVNPLRFYDCPICKNKGRFAYVGNGRVEFKDCSCKPIRKSRERIEKSGLGDLLERYTFETFTADNKQREESLTIAKDFASAPYGWFAAVGKPGTGKTHLCTAICKELINAGYDVRYFVWRTEAPTLKAYANTIEYEERTRPYKEVKVLYIDDFLKGKITEADINLAFDIINARYNDSGKITIISSERTVEEILDIDEALGSRIYGRMVSGINTKGEQNWRLVTRFPEDR